MALVRELRLARQEAAAEARASPPPGPSGADPRAYPNDPVGYAVDVLGITPTPDQVAIARALLEFPHRVAVGSANSCGKSFLCGWLVNWFFDSFDPGVCITTAPEKRSVKDTYWSEVRILRRGRPGFRGDTEPLLWAHDDHYAKGFTVRSGSGESWQGRHRARQFFLFEEAVGLHPILFETTRTMHKPDQGHLWLCVYNPTDTTSRMFVEEGLTDLDGKPFWRKFQLSALTHPNIVAELRGERPPIPSAVTVRQVEDILATCSEPLNRTGPPAHTEAEKRALGVLPTDLEWRPGSGRWYRPGPEFQARVLGRWPSAGNGVWSPALWEACLGPQPPFPLDRLPQLGCDCSMGKGEDYFSLHGRWRAVSIYHETSNTMDPARIALRIRSACHDLAMLANDHRRRGTWGAREIEPTEIPVAIDDDGTGNAVGSFLRAEGYTVFQIGAGTSARDEERFPNKRSELWFHTAEKAKAGQVCLSLLDAADRARLQTQLLAPTWDLDAQGRRKVEKKDDTKKKLRRSPDEADALNLSHYELAAVAIGVWGSADRTESREGAPRGGEGPVWDGSRWVPPGESSDDPRGPPLTENQRAYRERNWRSHRDGRQHFGYREYS
jgi:hypothetical protein